MLQKLSISNYALIDNLEITFGKGLNILTGETGAGKSIILGALSLILGQRAESRYFFNQQKKCVIEGQFSIGNFELKPFFEDNDLDYEAETVLRREISADGKSRAFVNDTPVNLNALKSLGEKLIDIHSQHATLEINDPEFQLLVVDAVAKHDGLLNDYRTKFRSYKKSTSKLKQLIEESDKAKADLDYYQFQFDELEKANLAEGEQEQLEQEFNELSHAEEIKRNLLGAYYLMHEGETSAIIQLREAAHQLSVLEHFNPQFAELYQRLNSAIIELKDVANEVEIIEQRTHTNEARAEEINARLSLIYNLQKKHRLNSTAELLKLQNELSDKIQQAVFGDEAIEKLRKQLDADRAELEKLAAELSANRKKAIPGIETDVLKTLEEMGMGNSSLKIELSPSGHNSPPNGGGLGDNGIDVVRFLFTANKGHSLAEMSKVASGGELSRLMLAIKSLITQNTALPTIIFDEIDTGVSGEVANKVGQIMERLADNLQVITITHLPQIASKGQNHYFVYKDEEGATTYTRMKQLDKQERVLEIAKMLSGDKPGESALQNARELLG
ncbi:DNA repair protein RecN [Mucilaginibacter gotjawali]|uniref:DNA repair protein RecN n=2 Tax=Mucilaginibacter gotjawali TaxID=1550579 RepID=A0A0X8X5P2_9SPHI|nr:DNA repair protein RecN [Mucilaginibacter gotjawali]MBB3055293.1 DNA repair protein RecN (Recombination protein N) [Mucilaginibacter gotjawali]BAU56089.1 DNA repair protein RecN [Mucilaginibacter gotjawali]